MLAALTKTQELALERGEAEALAVSVAKVAEHYDMGANMAPEALAWAGLVQTLALIYGPRVFAVRQRKRLEANAQNNGYQFQ